LAEGAAQIGADGGHDSDRRDCNQRGYQAVLDRCNAAFVSD